MSLQYLQLFSRSVVPSIPAESWGSQCLPRKGCFPQPLFLFDLDVNVWAACRALVNAFCKEVGLRNSLIWEFSATAWSNFVRRSFISEDWALIFPSFLDLDLVTAPSPSDWVSTNVAVTVLTDAFAATHWWVPRTQASSLWNWVNVICGICFSRVYPALSLILFKLCHHVQYRVWYLPTTC